MKDEIQVHSIPGSPFGRAVLVTLEEKQTPYRLLPLAPGSVRSQEHLAWHPFARIPAIRHGEFSLYETQAILRYLDRIIPSPALSPAQPARCARMDQLMNINDWYLFQGVGNVIGFQRVLAPRMFGRAPDEGAIAAAMPKAHLVFGELSKQLGDQSFFTGDSPTLADIMIAPQLDFLKTTPEWAQLTANSSNLCQWLDRMNARPSMVATTWERVVALAQAA